MFVAPSYQSLEKICEPYEVNNRMYVKVRMKNGSLKEVRAYSEAEYRKYYPEVKIIQPAQKPAGPRYTLGFGEAGYIHLFKGDTYAVLDWFKASPCRYCRPFGWYLPSTEEMPNPLPYGITPIKLNWEDVSEDGKIFQEDRLKQVADSLIYDPGVSEWQGEIGERLDFVATLTRAVEVNNDYGSSMFYLFTDALDNEYTWSTSSKILEEGKTFHVRGTVKGHVYYRNNKQTQLSRCAIKE